MKKFNGPWKIGDFDSIKDCNNKEVRAYGITLSDSDQAKINAKLIAAAPEILEAMQEFCDRVDRGEVRSKYTYAKFKGIIEKVNN